MDIPTNSDIEVRKVLTSPLVTNADFLHENWEDLPKKDKLHFLDKLLSEVQNIRTLVTIGKM